MRSYPLFFSGLAGLLIQSTSAAPVQAANAIQERGLVGDALSDVNAIVSDVGTPVTSLVDALKSVTATASPTDVWAASSTMSNIWEASPTPTNLYGGIAELVAAGLTTDNVETLLNFVETSLDGENSSNNINTREPESPVYPQADPDDAPYDLSEAALRAAIYIPSTFQYGADGAPQPIILVPGTGNTGYITFSGNLIPLLQGSTIADPVWLNIPAYLLNDAQSNAEYVAYAINYIHGISGCTNVAVAAWSQGNIDSQWAYKYWPSTVGKVTDHIAYSPDYHGTVIANAVASLGEPLAPAVLQQEYNSLFISTLRNNSGDSGYVPTTTIYSSFFDEVVEPMQGTDASAYLNDARNVGVSNNEVQKVCAGQLAGTFYTHEGTLYNPLGFALLKDALSNDGPGQPSRLNLGSVCNDYLIPGLDLSEFLLTETAVVIALLAIFTYPAPVFVEPPIKAYAQ